MIPKWLVALGVAAYVALIIVLVVFGGIGRVDAAVSEGSDTVSGNADHVRVHLRACLSDEGESAFPCAWFAPGMGNHRGHSFRIFKDGRVVLISDARAFHLLGDCDSTGPIYCRGA